MQAQGSSPRVQRAVLGLVLYEHPDAISVGALVLEVGDDAEQAIADLVAVGLLQRKGEIISATAAAIHFDWLGS